MLSLHTYTWTHIYICIQAQACTDTQINICNKATIQIQLQTLNKILS